ncbi:MAG TPA: ABC transporter permease [Bryobacteraceae bacterium]|jgi:putative ABC transport system permease protein|nr:ABC transporter permease [Bryobacteraceae bacterium]
MFSRLRAFLHRNKFEQDLDDELRLHLELRAADLARAGHSKDSAERQARLELGSREKFKDEVRGTAGIRFFDELSQDLRYALRILRQSPVFTIVAIGSLALGIGMNTALFSVVNTLLLKQLPYNAADRLVYVTEYWPHEPIVPGPPSPDFANWRANLKSVDGIAAYGGGASSLTLTGAGEPERIEGTMVTWQLLDLLGSTPAAGRNFAEQEDRLGAAPTVILGYGLWLRRFGASADVIGKVIQLDGIERTIVGVLPAGFEFPDNNYRHELLVPMSLPVNPNWQDQEHFRLLRVLVRRKPAVSLSALQQELTSAIQATASEEPPRMVVMRKNMEIRVTPLRQWLTGNVRTMILVLQGAVAMVLLIACLNIASLQVARAIARKKEIAVRASVGASGARLVRQLLTENFLVCTLAGLAGLLIGYLSLGALRTFLPANLHLADMLRLDTTVLAYTLAITLAAGVITGLVPALAALRAGLHDALKEEGRSSGSPGQRQIRGILVIAEIAAAMVLLIGSSLLIRTFVRLATAGVGFDPKGVLTLKVAPSPRKYPDAKRSEFYAQILENARVIPGVQAAAIGGGLPLIGSGGAAGVSFEGRPEPPTGGRPTLPVSGVSPDYFQALKIPLLRGRLFSGAEHEPAVIVNQAFAEEFYPGENVLGKHLRFGSSRNWSEIIGVVGNVKELGRRPVDPFMIYAPFHDSFEPETYLIVKSDLPLSGLVASASKAVHAIDPNQPVFDVASMEDRLHDSLSTQRANMTLMGVFAALALILATVGIFGVIAYFVNSRLQEIAIRIALGASSRTVVNMVLSHGMTLAAAGIAAGIVGALILTRTLGSLVEGIRTNDAISFIAAALLFGTVAALACSIPARRAARVDPMVALRHG